MSFLKWLPEVDFAVLEHRFAKHGRDYILLVEDCSGSNSGQHEIVFTYCVKAECETRVRDDFTTTLTKLNREEPAHDLFTMPTAYKVVNVAPEM